MRLSNVGFLAILASIIPSSPLLENLVGYYNLSEDSSDDSIDSTGLMGSMTASDSTPSVAGPGSNLARDFSTGCYLTQQVNFSGFANAPLTINFWIYQIENGGQYVWDCTNATSSGITCFLATDGGYVNMYAFPGGSFESPGNISTTFNYEEWKMFTFVWDGTNYIYYVDGVMVEAGPFSLSGPFDINVHPFRISSWFYPVNGYLSMFGLWAKALLGDDVVALYNSGVGLQYSEL